VALSANNKTLLLSLFLAVSANASDTGESQREEAPLYTRCENPRPEVCQQSYIPVCANRDSGIRCIKAPCPSEKKVTYSNGCMACADKKVYGFWDGACKDNAVINNH
jgi:hypothetical protein